MIFWDVAAIETGSKDVRNRNEILKIDMVTMRSLVQEMQATLARI
jgi:hypothetical protein